MARQVAVIVMEGLEKSGMLLPLEDVDSEKDGSLNAGAFRATRNKKCPPISGEAGAPQVVDIDFSESESDDSSDESSINRGGKKAKSCSGRDSHQNTQALSPRTLDRMKRCILKSSLASSTRKAYKTHLDRFSIFMKYYFKRHVWPEGQHQVY